jgi:hypothetical protein
MTAFFLGFDSHLGSNVLVNRLLEDNAILMLNRDIFHLAVSFAVTCAVVLNFDNYTPDFTEW